jgi:pimeloyl-ACP methyl ester carboxylesterase
MTARKPGKPNLRPVRELTPTLQYRTIHGYRRAYRIAGSGPAILLIHGIGDNSTTWSSVQSTLAQRFTVIAPDLLGHGKSDKPRADYSVSTSSGSLWSGIRSVVASRCNSPTSSRNWWTG